MNLRVLLTVATLMSGIAAAPRAQPPDDGAVYVVAYVEVMPTAEGAAVVLLKQYRDASRKEQGSLGLDVLQQIGRPDHFADVERWKGRASLDAHEMAAHTTRFVEALTSLRVSPYDRRTHTGLAPGAVAETPAGQAIYVVTHVDTLPPGDDEARQLLKQLAAATRREKGNLRFDVLQTVRRNHFTVLETWRGQSARDVHVMAAQTKQFREQLQRLAVDGSPYDERLYKAVE